ncbi:hypothetical protein [Pantoea sp. FN0307]|uniref:hypothetical protein n=1 Tax=unclassified Pantoea TaxID=2630326 RepID=UPI003CEF04A5
MWRKAKIAFTDEMAALSCSIVPAHPWIYGLGQSAETGVYLSPQNAVNYLAGKLSGQADSADVVVFMVSADTQSEFMSNLDALTSVFPVPAFTQVRRQAQAAAELAVTRMQIPAKAANELPAAQPLSVSTSRQALNAARITAAKAEAGAGASLAGMADALTSFSKARDTALASINEALNELKGKSADAWVFTGTGSLNTTASEMLRDIPATSSVYCVAMMFVGELDALRTMIYDADNYAGA